MRTADFMEDNKARAAHAAEIQRKNMLRQTQEGLDLELSKAVLNLQRLDPNWALGDEKYRAQKLDPIVRQWTQSAQDQAKDAGIQIPSLWLQQTEAKYTHPELRQGMAVGSANNIAIRTDQATQQVNKSVNLAPDGKSLLATMPQVQSYLVNTDDSFLSPKTRSSIYDNARKTAAERAVGLATRGLISEPEIEKGLQEQYWDNSQAEAMRAKLVQSRETSDALVKTNYDQMLKAIETNGTSYEQAKESPEFQAQARLIVKKGGGDVRATNLALDAMERNLLLSTFVGNYQTDLVNNRGTPDGAALWDKVTSTIAAMSDPNTARDMFSTALDGKNIGAFTDAEVAPAAEKILKSFSAWKRDIENGRANVRFSNDSAVVGYTHDNPTWNDSWSGRHGMLQQLRNAQLTAGVPDQYINPVHPAITTYVAGLSDKPADMRREFIELAGPQGLGSDTPELVKALAADKGLMEKRPEFVGAMSEIAFYAQLAPGDPRREGMEQTLDLKARTIDFINQGGIQNIQKQYPNAKTDAARTLLMMTGSVANNLAEATKVGAGLAPGKKGIEVEAELNSYAHFQTAISNTLSPRAAAAWHDFKVAETLLLAGGQGRDDPAAGLNAELGVAAARSFQTADMGMRVLQTNGTVRPFRDADLIAVPQSSRPREFLVPPDGTTLGADGYYSGLELSRTLDALVVSRPLLPASEVAPGTTRVAPAALALLGPAAGTFAITESIRDYMSGRSPAGGIARAWNEMFRPLARNWFQASIEDSLMPNQTFINYDPDVLAALPKESVPQYGTIAYKVGNSFKLYGAVDDRPRAPLEYVRKISEEAISGTSVAQIADRQQIAISKGISWRPRDGVLYAYGTPGALSGGEVSAGVQTAAPQQLYHVVDGNLVPLAIPINSLEEVTQVMNSSSGTLIASAISEQGGVRNFMENFALGMAGQGLDPMNENRAPVAARRKAKLERLKHVLRANQDEFSRSQINKW